MKEMSLFKILTGVFAFLMCLLLVIAPCFTYLGVTVSGASNDMSGYDLLNENANSPVHAIIESVSPTTKTSDKLKTLLVISKVDVIIMIVVGAVGMVLSGLSIFFFSHRANKGVAIGFSISALVLALLLTILSAIFVGTLNKAIKDLSSSFAGGVSFSTSSFVALILMGVLAIAYLVYTIIAKRNGKTGVSGDVHLGVASKVDIEDTTIKLLVAYKKAADEGVVGEMDFVEMKRAALIASNRGDVAYLQKQLYGIEKLTAYKMLFDQGVLTESEFNYKKNHLSGTTM